MTTMNPTGRVRQPRAPGDAAPRRGAGLARARRRERLARDRDRRRGEGRPARRAVGRGRARSRRGLRAARRAGRATTRLLWLTVPLPADRPEYPDLADIFAAANRMQRAVLRPRRHALDRGRPARVAAPRRLAGGRLPAAARLRRSRTGTATTSTQYRFVQVEGDGVHEIPVGPVHAGHHRARAFPLLDRRRAGAAARGAPRLHAQGDREAFEAMTLVGGGAARRAHLRRHYGRVRLGLRDGGRGAAGRRAAAARAVAARARCSSASASRTTWATSAFSATTAGSRSGSRSSCG